MNLLCKLGFHKWKPVMVFNSVIKEFEFTGYKICLRCKAVGGFAAPPFDNELLIIFSEDDELTKFLKSHIEDENYFFSISYQDLEKIRELL